MSMGHSTAGRTQEQLVHFYMPKLNGRNHVSGAMTMEVLALKEGLILARQMGVRRICSETDCVEVVHL
jgi:hypothetical protein